LHFAKSRFMLPNMTLFSSRLTRQPLIHDRAAAEDIAATFADVAPDLRDLLASAASCSPFLKGLMRREGDWLRAALCTSPEDALDQVMADITLLTLDQLPGGLRLAKRRRPPS
jgi:[glutamine synthetase] adenylyltransferase / [glutamine synthetase]-adenylyl-L-tyrosine phosphorylase